jgi:hypothetical protein
MISLEEDHRRGWFADTIRKAKVRSHIFGYFIDFPKALIIV